MDWNLSLLVRRRVELRHLGWAALLFALLMLLAQAGLDRRYPVLETAEPWWPTALRYTALLFVAGMLISRFRPHSDQVLLPVIGLLGGLSLMLMYRLPTPLWDADLGRYLYEPRRVWYMQNQARYLALGLALIVLTTALRMDLARQLSRYRHATIALGVGLLLGTAIWGEQAAPGGPRVSLDLGLFSFQPAELIKFLVVLFLAAYLARVQPRMTRQYYGFLGIALPRVFQYVAPLLLILCLTIIALVLMSDLGVALILIGLFPLLVLMALPPRIVRQVLVLTALGVGVVLLAPGYVKARLPVAWTENLETAEFDRLPFLERLSLRAAQSVERVEQRVVIWRDPWAACTPDGPCLSYQTLQGLYALAAGGLWGAGPGLGRVDYIPFVYTDLVFAALVEDWGLLGGWAVLGLYGVLLWRGCAIARRQTETFRYLLAVGIVALFALQIAVIVGGTLNILPLTGITLPFVSYGGSSLLVSCLLVGVLLRLSAEPSGLPAPADIQRKIDRFQRALVLGGLLPAGVLAYWTLWMGFQLHPAFPRADRYGNNPVAWQRQSVWLERVVRGRILAADGMVLAGNGPHGRIYRADATVHVVGHTDPRGMGVAGVEYALNDVLLGRGRADLDTLWARAAGGLWRGNDVLLTLDPQWQAAADQALGGYDGAVVVLDAQTGAVLAMVSHPLYDPPSAQDADARAALLGRADAPLLNRAITGLYPPGSTFKTVTAGAALEHGLATPQTVYDFVTDFWFWDDTGRFCHRRWVGGGVVASCNSLLQTMTLAEGFAWSDNILFAELAVALDAQRLQAAAAAYGFGAPLPLELPVAVSRLARAPQNLEDGALLAQSGFGQGQIVATPLQMALVAAAVANGGEVPQPHLVAAVLAPDGRRLQTTRPHTLERALSRTTADQLRQIMTAAVVDGWATGAAVPDLTVGGKTGTAEWEGTARGLPPHSWFIGFADYPDGRTVALAVLAEAAGDGSAVAAPIARAVLAGGGGQGSE